MTEDELLERVSKVDPDASNKLKEIYERVALDPKYAEKTNFADTEDEDDAAEAIGNLFLWDETEEGVDYWWDLKGRLEKANL